MKLTYVSKNGVPPSEQHAFAKMKAEFAKGRDSRHWHGYASFKLARGGRGAGDDDFDLVLLTRHNLFVIELKNWHGKKLVSNGNEWFVDGEKMNKVEPTPVQKARLNVKKLATALKERLGNDKVPFVRSYVVIDGSIEEYELIEDEADEVLSLSEFLEWADPENFDKLFPPPRQSARPGAPLPLNLLRHERLYDSFFQSAAVKPKDYVIKGFKPDPVPIFEHPNGLYKEFKAKATASIGGSEKSALLRQWDFAALGTDLIAEGSRGFIALREQRVFEYVEELSPELAQSLLRPIEPAQDSQIGLDFSELLRLPGRATRFSEFVNSELKKLGEEDRLTLTKSILARFADLHDLRIAHRDVGEHCIWIEKPARISISGFPAAYVPSEKTVGTFREKVKVERAVLPEDADPKKDVSPYRRDVFMLGALASQMLSGVALPHVSHVPTWSPTFPLPDRLKEVLKRALEPEQIARFENARAMLEALNEKTQREDRPLVDLRAFDAFRARSRERDYEILQQVVEDEDRSIFRSEAKDGSPVLVKVWNGIEPARMSQDEALGLFEFLEKARLARAADLPGYAKVIDFGLSRKSLLLVTEWIEGVTAREWLATNPSGKQLREVAREVAEALMRLHEVDLFHADVHPSNIIVRATGGGIALVDVLDYRGGEDAYTTAYLPVNYKAISPKQRDVYGAARVVQELLGIGTITSEASETVQEELSRLLNDGVLDSLEPLVLALAPTVKSQIEELSFEVSHPRVPEREKKNGELLQNNGELYLYARKHKSKEGVISFRLVGVGRELDIEWNVAGERAGYVNFRDVTQMALADARTMCDERLKIRVLLKEDARAPSVDELVAHLLTLPAVRKIWTATEEQRAPEPTVEREGEVPESANLSGFASLSVKEVWRSILDAEEDSLPVVVIADEYRENPARQGQLLVPYHSDGKPLEFEAGDKVLVESLGSDGNWHKAGRINLRESSFADPGELAVDMPSAKTRWEIGDKLRLQDTGTKSSLTRRTLATGRILEDKAVARGLVNYFADFTGEKQTVIDYPTPTPDQFNEYLEGEEPLNEGQAAALLKVLSRGPLGLLQGPPGTGKTKFIATLLHFLLTKQGVRRILLVSQSHEAVNNALDKALQVFRERTVTLDAVRLGPDSVVLDSDAIRPMHAAAIEQTYKERFAAEHKERVVRIAEELGLPRKFAAEAFALRTRLGRLKDRIDRLSRGDNATDQDEQPKAQRVNALRETFLAIAREGYGDTGEGGLEATLARIEAVLIDKHRVMSPKAIAQFKTLIRVSEDWLSALGSPQANFSEFLAKARAVVAGTVVGVGERSLGVVQNLYDWVIIDEAARASPSELAVAMQAGRRVLLVGDHKQLPPSHSDEVVKAIEQKFGKDVASLALASDFERVFESPYGQRVGTSLVQQYRMASSINDLVSSCFYTKKLETKRTDPSGHYELLPPFLSRQVTWIDMDGLGKEGDEQISEDKKDKWNSREADVAMDVLQSIFAEEDFIKEGVASLKPGEPLVGIISMYSRQRQVLDRLKAQASWLSDFRRLVRIDTVDAYQGKENRIVIVSTVRSNPRGEYGFLRESNRINVALSRAMDRLIILGSTRMWKGRNTDKPLGRVLSKVEAMVGDGTATIVSAREVLR